MKAIWVLENVKKDISFYDEFKLVLLLASVTLWKRYHPNHNTALYCDIQTLDVLTKLNVLSLWDRIYDLTYPEKINREIFWSSCKTKIISQATGPIVVIDHDFLIYTNIDKHLNHEVLYTHEEQAYPWYPSKNDGYCAKLPYPSPDEVDLAANVSLFYLPDPKFALEYGRKVLKNHEAFTEMNFENISPNYMIYSEQLMLKQLLVKDNIPHNTLTIEVFDNNKRMFSNAVNMYGIWSSQESSLYYRHYGMDKNTMSNTDLNDEIEYLYRCINSSKKINIKLLKTKINESHPRKLDKAIL
tara:strand:- start:249 stop:1145 length:897 start_codon:yes stop_codon:yes gene_type:complete